MNYNVILRKTKITSTKTGTESTLATTWKGKRLVQMLIMIADGYVNVKRY